MKYLKVIMYILLIPGYYALAYVLQENPSTIKYSWEMTFGLGPLIFAVIWIIGAIRLTKKTIKLN
tara:strand:+ start:385 stop:579 length:195 start_codon:yes stop_codon:yes gene_type:complete